MTFEEFLIQRGLELGSKKSLSYIRAKFYRSLVNSWNDVTLFLEASSLKNEIAVNN